MNFVYVLSKRLKESRNDLRAEKMSAYMKNRYTFFGVQAPLRKQIFRSVVNEMGLPIMDDNWQLVKECFNCPEREMHYIGLELCDRMIKNMDSSWTNKIEQLITTHSWWDTVDWLASISGKHFQRFSDLKIETTLRWNLSDNMWLNRASIIFQLHYKEATDFKMMKTYILEHQNSKEFFIQKAQGWALRQYGKLHPDDVVSFINYNPQLSNLTKREGLKLIK